MRMKIRKWPTDKVSVTQTDHTGGAYRNERLMTFNVNGLVLHVMTG